MSWQDSVCWSGRVLTSLCCSGRVLTRQSVRVGVSWQDCLLEWVCPDKTQSVTDQSSTRVRHTFMRNAFYTYFVSDITLWHFLSLWHSFCGIYCVCRCDSHFVTFTASGTHFVSLCDIYCLRHSLCYIYFTTYTTVLCICEIVMKRHIVQGLWHSLCLWHLLSDIVSVTVTLYVKLILPRTQSGSEADVIAFMYLRH